jgi:17beta-estradiol 17-dehydrogenase / very-long-chain 3-oxoacyl-CoA reductase
MKIKYFNRFVYFTGILTLVNYSKDLPNQLKAMWMSTFKTDQLSSLHDKYGNGWVIVTGGTSGIGLSFAQQLSKAGYNICIISRDQEKIEKTCLDLERTYGVKTKYINFNFSECLDENSVNLLKTKIEDGLGNEDISILINNVGLQYDSDFFFNSLKPKEIISYVSVNILSQMIMYHLFLEKMQKQKGRSLIIDVASSTTLTNALPNYVVYQSTKTFNARFSDLIKRQLYVNAVLNNSENNVDISLFNPGLTLTNLSERHKTKTLLSETSDNVVAAGLADIVNGNFVTAGAFKHKSTNFIMNFLPDYVKLNYFGPNVVKTFDNLRKNSDI